MGLFSAVQSVAEQSSDTIPEVKSLTVSIRKILPVAVICLVVVAVSALGTMAGVVILLLR